MRIQHNCFIVVFTLVLNFSFSQNDSLINKQPIVKGTLVDRIVSPEIKIAPVVDSLAKYKLPDNALAKEIDEKWKNELYNAPLFDTIYTAISQLDYDPVYYP